MGQNPVQEASIWATKTVVKAIYFLKIISTSSPDFNANPIPISVLRAAHPLPKPKLSTPANILTVLSHNLNASILKDARALWISSTDGADAKKKQKQKQKQKKTNKQTDKKTNTRVISVTNLSVNCLAKVKQKILLEFFSKSSFLNLTFWRLEYTHLLPFLCKIATL